MSHGGLHAECLHSCHSCARDYKSGAENVLIYRRYLRYSRRYYCSGIWDHSPPTIEAITGSYRRHRHVISSARRRCTGSCETIGLYRSEWNVLEIKLGTSTYRESSSAKRAPNRSISRTFCVHRGHIACTLGMLPSNIRDL